MGYAIDYPIFEIQKINCQLNLVSIHFWCLLESGFQKVSVDCPVIWVDNHKKIYCPNGDWSSAPPYVPAAFGSGSSSGSSVIMNSV